MFVVLPPVTTEERVAALEQAAVIERERAFADKRVEWAQSATRTWQRQAERTKVVALAFYLAFVFTLAFYSRRVRHLEKSRRSKP